MVNGEFSRRQLVQGSIAAAAMVPLAVSALPGATKSKARIYKTLKIGMVRVKGSLVNKFTAVKEAGFDGIEMNSPGMSVSETNQAIKETGLTVDGTVCSSHWKTRHTDPDKEVRAQALEDLLSALRATKEVGGHTVLLVVGKGEDGPESDIWRRSVDNISQALPLAAELGVFIAIENVWNQFLYDHDGPNNQSSAKFARYVDEFNSPWVGMQYDIGNHWKYGNCADWIRELGKRIVKLDLKGFSRAENGFKNIGSGDIDWASVREALDEIGYNGWAAAEVRGGDAARLMEVSKNMDRALGLT